VCSTDSADWGVAWTWLWLAAQLVASSAPPTSWPSAATTAFARIKDLTGGLGAHSVIEAVGTQGSVMQAIRCTRPGGHVGYVGVSHGVELPGQELFFSAVHLHGGPAPVRRFLPELIVLIVRTQIDPGKVFDLELPLAHAAEG
jgi:threonine dehydrogenase-like Zn-dependent dehydrogenase